MLVGCKKILFYYARMTFKNHATAFLTGYILSPTNSEVLYLRNTFKTPKKIIQGNKYGEYRVARKRVSTDFCYKVPRMKDSDVQSNYGIPTHKIAFLNLAAKAD